MFCQDNWCKRGPCLRGGALCSGDDVKTTITATESVEGLTNVGEQEEVGSSHPSWTILSPGHAEESMGEGRFHAWLKSSEECVEPESKSGGVVIAIMHGNCPSGRGRAQLVGQESFRASLTVEPTADSPVDCPSSCPSSDFRCPGVCESTVCCSDFQEACTINVPEVWSPIEAENIHSGVQKLLPLDSAECMAGKMVENRAGCARQSICDSEESVLGYTAIRDHHEKDSNCIKGVAGVKHGEDDDEQSDNVDQPSFSVLHLHQMPDLPQFPEMMDHKPSVGARHNVIINSATMNCGNI